PKKYHRFRWPAHSLPFASFSEQALMRGMRRLTLVPSLSVSTSSATGAGLSETAYFGFAMSRTTSISGSPGYWTGSTTVGDVCPPIETVTCWLPVSPDGTVALIWYNQIGRASCRERV